MSALREAARTGRRQRWRLYGAIALACLCLLFGGIVIGTQVGRNANNVREICTQLNEFKLPFYKQAVEQLAAYTLIQRGEPVAQPIPGVSYYRKHPEEVDAVIRQQRAALDGLEPKDCG